MNTQIEYMFIREFCEITKDLLCEEHVKSMKEYHHHGKIDTHFHSVYVAYSVFKLCKIYDISDTRDITRAALVHDFYLYDWHITKHSEMHAWYHPKAAYQNVNAYLFEPTPMQKDMILHHMFPLCKPPKSIGGIILTVCDKYCAGRELTGSFGKFIPIYNTINERCEKFD